MAGRNPDRWSDLSARSQRRYRSQGVTPAQYNAFKRVKPEEKREIRRAVRESGVGSSPAYRKVRDDLHRTGQYRNFWRRARRLGADHAEFDRRYVRAFGPYHQAKITGRPLPPLDYSAGGAVDNVLRLAGARPEELDLPPVGDTP